MAYIPKKKIKQNRADQNRKYRQAIYKSRTWRELRQAYIMSHPLCENCLKAGKVTPATDIHHKDSFMNYAGEEREAKAFDSTNLMALCKGCHSKLHAKEGRTHG